MSIGYNILDFLRLLLILSCQSYKPGYTALMSIPESAPKKNMRERERGHLVFKMRGGRGGGGSGIILHLRVHLLEDMASSILLITLLRLAPLSKAFTAA